MTMVRFLANLPANFDGSVSTNAKRSVETLLSNSSRIQLLSARYALFVCIERERKVLLYVRKATFFRTRFR